MIISPKEKRGQATFCNKKVACPLFIVYKSLSPFVIYFWKKRGFWDSLVEYKIEYLVLIDL